jgi:hypothetical protein
MTLEHLLTEAEVEAAAEREAVGGDDLLPAGAGETEAGLGLRERDVHDRGVPE